MKKRYDTQAPDYELQDINDKIYYFYVFEDEIKLLSDYEIDAIKYNL